MAETMNPIKIPRLYKQEKKDRWAGNVGNDREGVTVTSTEIKKIKFKY